MKRLIPAAAFVSALLAAACLAASPQILSTDLSGGDLTFFSAAPQKIALVAGLSAMARDHAVAPEIKALAAAIAAAQSTAAAHLQGLASGQHVPIDPEVDGAGKKQLQSLAKLKGAKFDKTYLDLLSDALDTLQQSLTPGATSSDAAIKSTAQSSLGTVKQEREMVRKLGI